MSPEILSVPEAAKVLNLGIRSVWSLIRDKSIPHMRIGPNGGKIGIRRQWCEEYLVRCTHGMTRQKSRPKPSTTESAKSPAKKSPANSPAKRTKKPSTSGKLANKTQQQKTRRKGGAK